MMRGLAALDDCQLTGIVNVGDDEVIYGLHVSPDIDTVIYTLAGVEGPQGWGLGSDTHSVMEALEKFPIDTWFRIGDGDLATNLFRTMRLGQGWTLSQVTTAQAAVFGVGATILPVSDDPIRTEVSLPSEGWISFQTYFVDRRHQSEIDDLRFSGATMAEAAPGVIDAIDDADLVVICPSNPPLSVWPILAVPGVAEAVESARRVVAVSPLFGGRPLKGPADRVMRGIGLPEGTEGILAAYVGLIDELVIDLADAGDVERIETGVAIRLLSTHIGHLEAARTLANKLVWA
jgi:LPPG:FO 2-phospho-L-lactate transferase